MWVRVEVVIHDLGVSSGEDASDKANYCRIEAKTGESLSEDFMVDKVEESGDIEHESC